MKKKNIIAQVSIFSGFRKNTLNKPKQREMEEKFHLENVFRHPLKPATNYGEIECINFYCQGGKAGLCLWDRKKDKMVYTESGHRDI